MSLLSWLVTQKLAPPLMPPVAFVSPRNTPDTVINSSRLLIMWSTEANWTTYDWYKIRRVDIRWPILATMPRWCVQFLYARQLNWNVFWVTGATVAQRSEKWASYGGNFRLKSPERRLNYHLLSLNSYYQGAHEQVAVPPAASVTLVSRLQCQTVEAVNRFSCESMKVWSRAVLGKELKRFSRPSHKWLTQEYSSGKFLVEIEVFKISVLCWSTVLLSVLVVFLRCTLLKAFPSLSSLWFLLPWTVFRWGLSFCRCCFPINIYIYIIVATILDRARVANDKSMETRELWFFWLKSTVAFISQPISMSRVTFKGSWSVRI